ncbi:MAG: hypothetical protein KDC98_26310, partial [Planctomycetes bacterium]|nr:hypothetical protein [Planctomycetota bacterium]
GATVSAANMYGFGARNAGVGTAPLGVTDAGGRLAFDAPEHNPMTGDKAECNVLVEAPGHALAYATIDLRAESPREVTLPAAATLRGRILGADGKPTDVVTLLPEFYARAAGEPDHTGFGVPPRPIRPGPDGRFVVPGLHPGYGFRLLALVEPQHAEGLGLAAAGGAPMAPLLWLAVGNAPGTNDVELGDLRFDRLTMTTLQVRDHNGLPAPGARLHVQGGDNYNSPIAYAVDKLGRLRFPLPTGEVRIGAWLPGGGVATRLVRVPPAADEPPLDQLELSLTTPLVLRGIVVDAAGDPVAGATVRPWNRPDGVDRELADMAFLSHVPSPPTGADGTFEVTLPIDEGMHRVRAHHLAEHSWRSSEAVMVDAIGDRGKTLRLQLGEPKPRR